MPDTPQTLQDLLPTTPDLRAERLAKLKRLFPDLFTNEGRLNPDELRQLVEPNEVHESERYEFKWYGKAASKREAFTPTTATLVYDEARSVNPDKANGNMIIEGENLETLKLLLNAYREQVKCIYIDPPYNTGKDFIYRDNYKKDKANYWEETGTAENGIQLDTNPDTSGRYHSDWLCFMQERLLVSRQLLKSDGVIFISIDDNEYHNLKKIGDEIFGLDCYLGTFIWHRRQRADSRNEDRYSPDHDFILAYKKSEDGRLRGEDVDITKYSNPDNDPRGDWASIDLTGLANAEQRPNLHYDIIDPETGIVYPPNPNRGWSKSKHRVEDMISEGRILFPKTGKGRPREKKFVLELRSEVTGFSSVLSSDVVGFNMNGTREILDIFGDKVFDFPKPSSLIKEVVNQTCSTNDIILDFFAGSGTTAQAILELNLEDNRNRKYISIQIPEATPLDSPARKIGLKTISSITIERVKRVIQGYGDNPQPMPEAGFKVYKLRKSNFPRCEFKPDPNASEADNVAALQRYIDEKEAAFFLSLDAREEQAVFDEVLLKNGFQLHYQRQRRDDFPHNSVYEVSDSRRSAIVCLAGHESIQESTLRQLRHLAETHSKPHFICLERSLTTTSKWNLKHFLGDHFVAF